VSESLDTGSLVTRYPSLADFLAARDWGLMRSAVMEEDFAAHERKILRLIFAKGEEYAVFIYSNKDAAAAYDHIVEYLKRLGYSDAAFFEQGRIYLDVGYGGFHRNTEDLKRDLGIFERDLPPMPAPIDLNHEAENLGLSRTDALKLLQREAAQQAAQRKPGTRRLKWEKDARSDENPAAFAWRAYQAEAKAGTLHRGVIGREDKDLAVKLGNWLRTHDMPEGIDIPTKPEWNTRELPKLGGKAERSVLRLYEVAKKRKGKLALAAA
jgi:hypothetical protein